MKRADFWAVLTPTRTWKSFQATGEIQVGWSPTRVWESSFPASRATAVSTFPLHLPWPVSIRMVWMRFLSEKKTACSMPIEPTALFSPAGPLEGPGGGSGIHRLSPTWADGHNQRRQQRSLHLESRRWHYENRDSSKSHLRGPRRPYGRRHSRQWS